MPPFQTPPIRVLIVGDYAIVRAGLCMLIESRPGLAVAGEAGNGRDALAIGAREQPDIILLVLDLGGDSAFEVLPELLATTQARLVLLTGARDPELHRRAVHLGATGLVLKDQAVEILLRAIEKVHAGEAWLERTMTAQVLTERAGARGARQPNPEATKIATLTLREREVIPLVGEGLKNKQIADRLSISEATVNHHLTSIFNKLGVPGRLELVVYAYRHGLAKLAR